MLAFATEFPIERTRTTADFLRAVQSWVLGSPHTGLAELDLAGLQTAAEWRGGRGNEYVDSVQVHGRTSESAAVRYRRLDEGLEWLTSVVFSRTGADSWVGIRVSCESAHPAVRLPAAKKPVLVRTLLDALGGSSDGALRVSGTPLRLDNADIDVASQLIAGDSGCRLPVVYVSAAFNGGHIVDVDRLARDLAGMAHVVVEPNRHFSLRLKIEVDSENVYGGTVGVYWPDGGGRRSFFIRGGFESPEDVSRAVFDEIRTALTNRRAFDRCTLAFVQELASRSAIEQLRTSGSQEVEKYVQTFDLELAAKSERLKDAEAEIARLHTERRIYEARLAAGTGAILKTGGEQDLYPNEVLRIIRDALEDARTRVAADSRRQHVLDAVLGANTAPSDEASALRERLKEALRDARGMEARTRRELEALGFVITEDGKHFKLLFRGDDRYTFTLAKTGSDWRGGLNAASDISRLLF